MATLTTVAERVSRRSRIALTFGVVVALLAAVVATAVYRMAPSHPRSFPQSSAMEDKLGVRFSRIAVVGDGGLITLSYVVLDSDKATRFQADTANPPVLVSQERDLSTKRVSLMKQGHSLRAGQTYYLVYENTKAALRPGEEATIVEGGMKLKDAPVL